MEHKSQMQIELEDFERTQREKWFADGRPVTIRDRVYKLDECELVEEFGNGKHVSDYTFWVERLYKTASGKYFVYHCGGPSSPFAVAVGDKNSSQQLYTGTSGYRFVASKNVSAWIADHKNVEDED